MQIKEHYVTPFCRTNSYAKKSDTAYPVKWSYERSIAKKLYSQIYKNEELVSWTKFEVLQIKLLVFLLRLACDTNTVYIFFLGGEGSKYVKTYFSLIL
jgi:hypothetical protein